MSDREREGGRERERGREMERGGRLVLGREGGREKGREGRREGESGASLAVASSGLNKKSVSINLLA